MKPCPFCGSSEIKVMQDTHSAKDASVFWVRCRNCLADGPNCQKPQEAEATWNKALRAELPEHMEIPDSI